MLVDDGGGTDGIIDGNADGGDTGDRAGAFDDSQGLQWLVLA